MMWLKIISGGQTGADTGALHAAKAAGLETGGWAPHGFRTEAGAAPWLADYGLKEHTAKTYPARTRANVAESDATLVFDASPGVTLSSGTGVASGACDRLRKPFRCVLLAQTEFGIRMQSVAIPPDQIAAWLVENHVRVLNVGGNRESKSPGIGAFVEKYLAEVFRLVKEGR